MDSLVSVLRTRLKGQQLRSGQLVKSAVAATGSIASNSAAPNPENSQCHQEAVEISFHPRSMNMEDGIVLSSRGDLSFTPRKNEQSLLARMHNWNIMASFTATCILNLHCFSSSHIPTYLPLIYSITTVHLLHIIPYTHPCPDTVFLHVSRKPQPPVHCHPPTGSVPPLHFPICDTLFFMWVTLLGLLGP